jgi:Ca2+-binding EF-hand superfamily protein
LTPEEVLAAAGDLHLQQTKRLMIATDQSTTDGTLRISTVRDRSPVLSFSDGSGFSAKDNGDSLRLQAAGSIFDWTIRDRQSLVNFTEIKAFYLAAFQAAVGQSAALELKQVDDDANLSILEPIFSLADRNGDGKLTAAELEAFLKLIGEGASCQTIITISDRGRNLFDHLDTNGNGRLEYDELRRAAELLGEGQSWSRDDIPARFAVTIGPRSDGGTFGPVKLTVRSKRSTAVQTPTGLRGPRWFRAMDRNGDGYLSPGEFLGPPELFRLIDSNGDGLISPEEAEKAEKLSLPNRR